MGKLEGKVALITGASKGIGEGIAKVYARQGANLILCARSDSTQEFCNQLEKQYGIKSIFVKTDVTKMDDCKNAVNKGINCIRCINFKRHSYSIKHLTLPLSFR